MPPPTDREKHRTRCLEAAKRARDLDAENMTMEQVEAIIAEQMQNLPKWWEEDCRRAQNISDGRSFAGHRGKGKHAGKHARRRQRCSLNQESSQKSNGEVCQESSTGKTGAKTSRMKKSA